MLPGPKIHREAAVRRFRSAERWNKITLSFKRMWPMLVSSGCLPMRVAR